jgi:hypothetical protein
MTNIDSVVSEAYDEAMRDPRSAAGYAVGDAFQLFAASAARIAKQFDSPELVIMKKFSDMYVDDMTQSLLMLPSMRKQLAEARKSAGLLDIEE